MTRRTRGREIALQVLYQTEQNPGPDPAEVRRFIDRRLLGDKRLVEFAEGLIAGVHANQPRIDALITEVAENWRLDRMAAIDRNILRLGAYEMLFCPEVPTKVAINEALELAKRYSTAQSSRFVNGILDRLQAAEADPAAPAGPAPEARCPNTRSPSPRGLTGAGDPARRSDPPRPARRGPTCTSTRPTPTASARPARSSTPRRASAWRRWRSPTTTRSRPWPSPAPRPPGWASSWSAGSSGRPSSTAARSTSSATSSATTTPPSSPPRPASARPGSTGWRRWPVGSRLGLSVDLEGLRRAFPRATLGRRHLADWLVRTGQVAGPREAFARYLGDGGPADVPKPRLPWSEAVALTVGAGGRRRPGPPAL